jgi:hypothetical protein
VITMTATVDERGALLLPREVAELRRKTVNALAVERWRGQGPPYVKLGGRVFYRADDVAAYIAAHTITPGSPPPQSD